MDLDSLTAPMLVIFVRHLRSSSSSVSLSGYIGPHGGIVLSLKSLAWSYAICRGSSKEASVVMMLIYSAYSLGTQSMAASSSSSIAAAAVRGVPERYRWFSTVHFRWHSLEVNLMHPLLPRRSDLCFARQQWGRITSQFSANGATLNDTLEKWWECCSTRGAL